MSVIPSWPSYRYHNWYFLIGRNCWHKFANSQGLRHIIFTLPQYRHIICILSQTHGCRLHVGQSVCFIYDLLGVPSHVSCWTKMSAVTAVTLIIDPSSPSVIIVFCTAWGGQTFHAENQLLWPGEICFKGLSLLSAVNRQSVSVLTLDWIDISQTSLNVLS